jgi:hypothetical protein
MANDFIWTANGPIPRGYWMGNNFMLPPVVMPTRRPTEVDFLPDIDDDGTMTTAGVPTAPFVTEGTGRNQGPGEAGLGRGPADIGYAKGGATADMTTTATDNTKDFAKSVATGLGLVAGGPLVGPALIGHTLFGQTPLGYIGQQISDLFSNTPNPANATPSVNLSYGPSEASGFADYGTANAPDPNAPGVGTNQVGQANDPFGGATGLGQGGGDTGSAK